jgi:hypothetical protein
MHGAENVVTIIMRKKRDVGAVQGSAGSARRGWDDGMKPSPLRLEVSLEGLRNGEKQLAYSTE